jgi:hypothetical protein
MNSSYVVISNHCFQIVLFHSLIFNLEDVYYRLRHILHIIIVYIGVILGILWLEPLSGTHCFLCILNRGQEGIYFCVLNRIIENRYML